MHDRATLRTTAGCVQLCMFAAMLGVASQALADGGVDCTRYRIAGLPCPTTATGAPTVSPRPSRPVHTGAADSMAPTRTGPPSVSSAPSPPTTMAGAAPTQTLDPVQPSPVRPSSSSAPAPAPVPAPVPVAPAPALPMLQTTPAAATPIAKPHALVPGSTLLPLALMPLPTPVAPREGREPGQIVVYWAIAEEAATDLAILLQVRHMAPAETTRLEHLGGVIAVFQLPTPALANDTRMLLRRDFPAATVDFNTRYRPLQQLPARPRLYLPQKIDLPDPATTPLGGAGVRVGIVDGPVARTTALARAKIVRRSFLANTDTAAPVGHATAIASLIAGQDPVVGFFGMARQANLFSAEVMRAVGPDDLTSSSALLRALDWLLAEKVQLINLSLGGQGDLVMEKAFAKLATLNVILVAAAGNGGPAASPAYPAAYPGVIAVTATDAVDNLYVQANRGSYITLAAPGVDIWVPDTELGHYVSGTSFSAAVVTGASALLLSLRPQPHGKAGMSQRLCRGAKDIGAHGVDALYGCGLLQIGALLREDRS